jgi:hypothetical protein
MTVRTCYPDPERLLPLAECMQTYGVGDPSTEWPHNCISTHTIAHSCGALTRQEQPLHHEHDQEEWQRCQHLATTAAQFLRRTEVGMGSESTSYFQPFYMVTPRQQPLVTNLSADSIRMAFQGVIYPSAPIRVEPLDTNGIWWHTLVADYRGVPLAGLWSAWMLRPWRRLIHWFQTNSAFITTAFVLIGSDQLDEHNRGCVFPRLALGMTNAGSLVGICGDVVRT